MGASELVHVGVVGKPHGVRGEVKVVPHVDEPERLSSVDVVYLGRTAENAVRTEVEGLRFQHSKKGITMLMKLQGHDTPEAVQDLRGWNVLVHESTLPLAEDEVFADDLVGFEVVDTEGTVLGRVEQVLDMPAQIVYEIRRQDGGVSLVPGVEEFVVEIDTGARRMILAPIEGLLE